MTINGKKYDPKPVDAITIGEFSRFVAHCERAASEPDEFLSELRAAAIIILPHAVLDSRHWTGSEILVAAGGVLIHLGGALQTIGDANQRFLAVAETLELNLAATSEVLGEPGETEK
jgi:hypothetical protein